MKLENTIEAVDAQAVVLNIIVHDDDELPETIRHARALRSVLDIIRVPS